MKIKIFLDGADRATMLEMARHPSVRGFTTNPSLMKKAGVKDYTAFAKELLTQITDRPISFEVFADDFAEMERQAGLIRSWAPNVYVKIPVTNSKGESSAPLIRSLTRAGTKLNVTAIFTTEQVTEVCAALREGAPSFVSVFAGRIADTGADPVPMMRESLEICRGAGPQIELLWASCREFYNIVQADEIGCPIITAPADMIKKISMLGKSPAELSLETVRAFKSDSEAAGFRL